MVTFSWEHKVQSWCRETVLFLGNLTFSQIGWGILLHDWNLSRVFTLLLFIILFFSFETGAGFELAAILPLLPKCWDHGNGPQYPGICPTSLGRNWKEQNDIFFSRIFYSLFPFFSGRNHLISCLSLKSAMFGLFTDWLSFLFSLWNLILIQFWGKYSFSFSCTLSLCLSVWS